MTGILREPPVNGAPQGKLSFSRTMPCFFAGMLTVAWAGVGAWIVWAAVGEQTIEVWPKVEGWLDWGRDFAFITVLPYLGMRLGQIGRRSDT